MITFSTPEDKAELIELSEAGMADDAEGFTLSYEKSRFFMDYQIFCANQLHSPYPFFHPLKVMAKLLLSHGNKSREQSIYRLAYLFRVFIQSTHVWIALP